MAHPATFGPDLLAKGLDQLTLCRKQAPGLPAQPGAGGGHMTPGLVSQAWSHFGGALKGLMTWSINWDGARGWSFGDNVKSLQGR